VSIRYIKLADYLAIAAEITGLDPTTLTRITKLGLAESALHAPSAGFGETEFYPDFIDKAAVLTVQQVHALRIGKGDNYEGETVADDRHDGGTPFPLCGCRECGDVSSRPTSAHTLRTGALKLAHLRP
jgi:hypothetical protein